MEMNATEGALSNYAATLKTMDATFTFISATAFFSSAAEKSHPGHKSAAEPDGAYIVCRPHLGMRGTSFFNVPSIICRLRADNSLAMGSLPRKYGGIHTAD